MKLLVMDGNSIINRAFYGIKILSTKSGIFTNGIYGFMNILNKLIEQEHPDGVAVAFDLKGPTFRHKKYAGYKAGRRSTPPELLSQMPILKQLLELFGYFCIEKEGFEADDILGTLARAAERSGDTCVISTGDRDSLQLISPKTKILLASTKMGRPDLAVMDEAALMEKYGLKPRQMIDLKALMGDPSDKIPGVAGIGEKTALELLHKFESLDGVYENLDSNEIKPAVRQKLAAGRDDAYLSFELGTICCDVPIDTDLAHYQKRPENKRELAALLRGLEFYKMLEKLGLSDGADEPALKPDDVFIRKELQKKGEIFIFIQQCQTDDRLKNGKKAGGSAAANAGKAADVYVYGQNTAQDGVKGGTDSGAAKTGPAGQDSAVTGCGDSADGSSSGNHCDIAAVSNGGLGDCKDPSGGVDSAADSKCGFGGSSTGAPGGAVRDGKSGGPGGNNTDLSGGFCESPGDAAGTVSGSADGVCAAAAFDGGYCTLDGGRLRELLSTRADSVVVHDSKALYRQMLKDGARPKTVKFDTMLAGYLLSPSASAYDLEKLFNEYIEGGVDINGATEGEQTAVKGFLTYKAMKKAIDDAGQHSLLADIELPLALVLAEMEEDGFYIDRDGLRRMGDELKDRIIKLEERIYASAGREFNINSPKQLGTVLFEDLQLPARKKTKSGYSTSAEVLEQLRDSHPVIPLILEYRVITKLKATYCDGLLKAAGDDGVIHTTFNQTEARTGRISSIEPNLQNIPVRREEGKKLRRFFTARPGNILLDADYSQIELRVLAHIAGDKNMIKAFREGVDIHTLTASQVFNLPPAMVTPLLRSRAKAVNFGIVYGIGAFSLSKDIGVTRAEADSYIKGYFETYPQVAEYMENIVERAKADGYVTTMFGRRRYLPELSSSNGMLRAFGERVARNMPIQGTAADIIKIAMIRVRDRLLRENKDAKIILQVHDELIVEASEKDAEAAAKIMKEEMQGAADMAVELSCSVSSGKTWFDAKQ